MLVSFYVFVYKTLKKILSLDYFISNLLLIKNEINKSSIEDVLQFDNVIDFNDYFK